MYEKRQNSNWFTAKVIKGKGLAQKLEFPTLNLDNSSLLFGKKEGVYAAWVKIRGKLYKGILYFGPRLILGEKENIIEIFVFEFNQEIYGKPVSFQLVEYIREVKNFPDFNLFKKQLELDCQRVLEVLK